MNVDVYDNEFFLLSLERDKLNLSMNFLTPYDRLILYTNLNLLFHTKNSLKVLFSGLSMTLKIMMSSYIIYCQV